MALFPRPVGKIKLKTPGTPPMAYSIKSLTLSQGIDILTPALGDFCHKYQHIYGPLEAQIFADFSRDVLQLIIRDHRGRAYNHPRFLESKELVDGSWFGVVEERFKSTLDGIPTRRPGTPMKVEPSFSLNELEEAEKLMESLK